MDSYEYICIERHDEWLRLTHTVSDWMLFNSERRITECFPSKWIEVHCTLFLFLFHGFVFFFVCIQLAVWLCFFGITQLRKSTKFTKWYTCWAQDTHRYNNKNPRFTYIEYFEQGIIYNLLVVFFFFILKDERSLPGEINIKNGKCSNFRSSLLNCHTLIYKQK